MATTSSRPPAVIPPNQTLYISNLNDRIRKPDLRTSLYTLFSTYGVVLDVNALLTMKCRGQAHVVFRDIASATQAMRALQGFEMFGKDMVRRSSRPHSTRKYRNLVRKLERANGARAEGFLC